MTTTFEDNTEVTLADLNSVAIDLGDTDFSAFSTEKFGVDKLNQITSDLVSSGVLRTGANEALGCEVIESNGMAYVQAGVIVFASGAKIRITEPVGIDILPGTSIYALYDATTGKASLEASEALPSGDYVLLAEVNAEGVLADRRSGCVANVTLSADTPNTFREVSANIVWAGDDAEYVIDVGTSAFTYIFIKGGAEDYGTSKYRWVPAYENAFCLTEGEEVEADMGRYNYDGDEKLYITKQGQYLHMKIARGSVGVIYTFNFVAM